MDQAELDLNPKIGPSWTPRGVQPTVVTPGRNRKTYVAGALNARTLRVLWVEQPAKRSELFIALAGGPNPRLSPSATALSQLR